MNRGNQNTQGWCRGCLKSSGIRSSAEVTKDKRRLDKRCKPNNRDANVSSVPETLPRRRLISVSVESSSSVASSTLPSLSLHSPTHKNADFKGEIEHGLFKEVHSISKHLQTIVNLADLLWHGLFKYQPCGTTALLSSWYQIVCDT